MVTRLLSNTEKMVGWIDHQLCEKIDDTFVRGLQERIEDGYWLLRETKLDNIDRDAKAICNELEELLKRVP